MWSTAIEAAWATYLDTHGGALIAAYRGDVQDDGEPASAHARVRTMLPLLCTVSPANSSTGGTGGFNQVCAASVANDKDASRVIIASDWCVNIPKSPSCNTAGVDPANPTTMTSSVITTAPMANGGRRSCHVKPEELGLDVCAIGGRGWGGACVPQHKPLSKNPCPGRLCVPSAASSCAASRLWAPSRKALSRERASTCPRPGTSNRRRLGFCTPAKSCPG